MTVTEGRLREALRARADQVPPLDPMGRVAVGRPRVVRRPFLAAAVAAATVAAIAVAFSLTRAPGRAEPADGHAFQRMSASPLSPRSGHSAAWTGSELFIWGGEYLPGSNVATAATTRPDSVDAVSPFLADGALYNPATDTWRTIAPSPLPGRRDAPAVAVGTDVYVLGGDQKTGREMDAAKFDPAADTWTTLPAPPDRMCVRLAVGAGTTIFVAGEPRCDRSTFDLLADSIARYDTQTGQWSALPYSGIGAVRQLAPWRDTVVAVDDLGHVSRYDAAHRAWTAMPPVPGMTVLNSVAASGTGSLALTTEAGVLTAVGTFQSDSAQGVRISRWDDATNAWTAPIDLDTAILEAPPSIVAAGDVLIWPSASAGLAWYDGTPTPHYVTDPQAG
ncbi:MAG: hypothetical protein JWM93_1740, partial [Frankiales bacterium]|nr:hypothetical protein [Frankiales bacterium]